MFYMISFISSISMLIVSLPSSEFWKAFIMVVPKASLSHGCFHYLTFF